MRRFSEVLLLVSFTLLPSLFVNAFHELIPTINYKPARRDTVIRGLLISRQDVCTAGNVPCGASDCCPVGWNCCSDGNCCEPGTVCTLASNGNIGCCPDGEVCTGPVGGPTLISSNGPAPPTNTLPGPLPSSAPPSFSSVTVPPAVPSFNSVPPAVPSISSETLVPAPVPSLISSVAPIIQSTVDNIPATLSTIGGTGTGTGISLPTTSSTKNPLSAAGQAQLYRPLLVLVGILLAVHM